MKISPPWSSCNMYTQLPPRGVEVAFHQLVSALRTPELGSAISSPIQIYLEFGIFTPSISQKKPGVQSTSNPKWPRSAELQSAIHCLDSLKSSTRKCAKHFHWDSSPWSSARIAKKAKGHPKWISNRISQPIQSEEGKQTPFHLPATSFCNVKARSYVRFFECNFFTIKCTSVDKLLSHLFSFLVKELCCWNKNCSHSSLQLESSTVKGTRWKEETTGSMVARRLLPNF